MLLLLLLLGLVEERFDGIVDDGHIDDSGHRSWLDRNVLVVVEGEECIELVSAERSVEVTCCVRALGADLTDEIDVVIAIGRTGKTAHDIVDDM